MSTSLRSVRVEGRALVFFSALFWAAAVAADGAAVASPVSKADAAALTRAAQVAIRQQDDMPNDSDASIAWVGPLRRTGPGEHAMAVVGVVRFAGLANRYCRVFVAGPTPDRAAIVPLPAVANHDHCIRAEALQAVDVDGDGQPDLAHGVEIRSNRYPVAVSEVVVYLARRDAPSGYCYSADASRALAGANARSAAALAAAASAARGRAGQAAFTCGSR